MLLPVAKYVLSLAGIFSLVPWPDVARANDVCAEYCDYLCRHYRKDLRPQTFRISEHSVGSFMIGSLLIKNGGDVTFSEPGEVSTMKVSISGLTDRTVAIWDEIPAGETKWVGLGGVGSLKHCDRVKVRIDVNKDAGQWGCNVYTNDTKMMTVLETGNRTPCRFIP